MVLRAVISAVVTLLVAYYLLLVTCRGYRRRHVDKHCYAFQDLVDIICLLNLSMCIIIYKYLPRPVLHETSFKCNGVWEFC